MKVIVTGGAGFIGSHVVKILLDKGHEVRVIDNLSRGFESLVDKRAEFHKEDLKNQEKITRLLNGYEAVIHLGNFIVVSESIEKAVEYTENNVVNTVKLLEAMREAKVKKIIFSSSATVYGEPKELPLKEDAPIEIQSNQYGASKVAMESFISTYHQLYGCDVILLRYFNPYGPNELHKPETHAIPNFIKAALERKPIPLYWKGKQVRDFIYVEDLARAHTDVLEVKGLEIFNIGTGSGTKISDTVNMIFKIIGYQGSIQDLGSRQGDVKATYASSQKIEQAVGWKSETSLAKGLEKTIAFFKQLHEK